MRPDVYKMTDIGRIFGLSSAGAWTLMNRPDFPTTQTASCRVVHRPDLIAWLLSEDGTKYRHMRENRGKKIDMEYLMIGGRLDE